MKTILHILTAEPDAFVADLMSRQRVLPDCAIEVVDLTVSSPDYRELLDQIFHADSIVTW